MGVSQIDRLEEYLQYLTGNPIEVEALFRDFLIGVTQFFRDGEAFAAIQEKLFPKLFEKKESGAAIRIWVPGCSSGEEAYSYAMLLQEYIDSRKQHFHVQIFATDIDSESIEKARMGVYPENIAADVSEERLSQFFSKTGTEYRIRKSIRDMVVFAKQDIIKDPPFSKLDLVSCRNLLIYFGNDLQKRMIPLFQYALNDGGFLVLGNSESIGEFTQIFSAIDKKWKLYRRIGSFPRHPIDMVMPSSHYSRNIIEGMPMDSDKQKFPKFKEMIERTILDQFSHPCVVVNTDFDILYIHGHIGKYLEPAAGVVNNNIIKMVREGLKMELVAGLRKVLSTHSSARYDGIKIKSNGNYSIVNLIVQPFKKDETTHGLMMVIFEEVADHVSPSVPISSEAVTDKDLLIRDLQMELKTKEEYLQTAAEEFETSSEELKSTNEELQSSNEELQSSNEELETSKEELQSVNEELATVNIELQKKIEELSEVNNDINNLLAATGIGTIFLDFELNIQRFTPAATQIINLIKTDLGRPVSDIASRLVNYENLVDDVKTVLNTLVPKETKVQTTEGRRYIMRIQPYRTVENVIEGAVLTFVELAKLEA